VIDGVEKVVGARITLIYLIKLEIIHLLEFKKDDIFWFNDRAFHWKIARLKSISYFCFVFLIINH